MDIRLKGDWYVEQLTKDEVHAHLVKRRIAKVRTPFQTAEIVDTVDYGRCLFLDGLVQSTEFDEFIYHECLIHPALMLHSGPKSLFIAGGGEGAPLREALKHPSVRTITMVEIDEKVVRLAKRHLPRWHQGAFDDPRVSVLYEDARAFLQKDTSRYDAMFLDLCDPGESGPAQKLFTVEFYRTVRQRLTRDGILVVQSGSANFNMAKGFSAVYQSLKKVFRHVLPYLACVPAYVGPWSFMLASNKPGALVPDGSVLESRFRGRRLNARTRFYDPRVHQALFVLPPHFEALLGRGRPISERNLLRLQRH